MAPREATARAVHSVEGAAPVLQAIPGYGGGAPRGGRGGAVSNAHIGVLVLLAAETMLFTGVLGAYVLFRTVATSWPPAGLPRLPLLVTTLNTLVLLASGYTMHRARVAARAGDHPILRPHLIATAALGLLFLGIQGAEWVRLVHHGLTLASGTYGASFYTLIGLHGVHVLAAVAWLLVVTARVGTKAGVPVRSVPVDVCGIYWNYVVALWLVLFGLVYVA
jgi:cytochrome c oxidase subunit 3